MRLPGRLLRAHARHGAPRELWPAARLGV